MYRVSNNNWLLLNLIFGYHFDKIDKTILPQGIHQSKMTFMGPLKHKKEQSQEFGWPSSYPVEMPKLFMPFRAIKAPLPYSKLGSSNKML